MLTTTPGSRPSVRQILPGGGGEPCGSSEVEGFGRRRHVVLEVVLEGMMDEGRKSDRAAAGFRLRGSEDPTESGGLMGLALVNRPIQGSPDLRLICESRRGH
jgi:hypothetical protein